MPLYPTTPTGATGPPGPAGPPATPFVESFDIYVAPNGNDTTGNGAKENPYLTISNAIIQR